MMGVIDIGGSFEQKYRDVLEEFVAYANERPRPSRADYLDALLKEFIYMKMQKYKGERK